MKINKILGICLVLATGNAMAVEATKGITANSTYPKSATYRNVHKPTNIKMPWMVPTDPAKRYPTQTRIEDFSKSPSQNQK